MVQQLGDTGQFGGTDQLGGTFYDQKPALRRVFWEVREMI